MVVRTEHVLSVMVSTGKVGYAFFVDGKPYDWKVSFTASTSTRTAYEFAMGWIEYYQPQLIITERISLDSRKQTFSRELVDAIMKAAQDSDVLAASVDRVCNYENKFKEAEVIAKRFPELKSYLPKPRKYWEPEPRQIIIFEAVSLALRVIEGQ